jgi:hypothetical protein
MHLVLQQTVIPTLPEPPHSIKKATLPSFILKIMKASPTTLLRQPFTTASLQAIHVQTSFLKPTVNFLIFFFQ